MSTLVSRDNDVLLLKPPFVQAWDARRRPLPVRPLRLPGRPRPRWPDLPPPPWLGTGPLDQPFDFCQHMALLCQDIVERCAALSHIDVSRLLFAVTQARTNRPYGLQARVTPMRFRDGGLRRVRRGVCYQVQRFFVNAREMLYLITFCLPRFLDQDFDDKFITLFHELYHISPEFNGDLRRHEGRYSVHSHSQKAYDAYMAQLARAYLSNGCDKALHNFLRLDFAQLQRRHGSVMGAIVPRPKLIPVWRGKARK
ncbi:MAG: putative metallopeptidase [Gemmataceae bacterium]